MAEDESQPQSPDASPEARADRTSTATPGATPAEEPTEAHTEAPAEAPAEAPVVVDYGTEELALPNPTILTAIGLLLLSVVTFLPTLHARPTWLDDVSLTDNPLVQTTSGVARFWTSTDRAGRYQPMALTSFWLGIRFFHNSLPAQHLISILLHAGVVILLWTLLRRLDVPGAAFAAAMFAVHPVHMQAIAWLSGRSVVLASAFYLASMLVYLRFLELTPAAEVKTLFTLPPEPERLWGLSFVLFLCAIFSNAAASLMFPVAILLLLWWKREKVTAREWLCLLPFFLAAIAGAIWVGWLQANAFATEAITAAFGTTPIPDRIFIGLRAIWFYAVKIILPFPLMFDYPRWTPSAGLGAICAVLLIAALGALWALRPRIGRGPLVAALLFVVAIVPMLNLLDPPGIRYSFVADNRQYLASAALLVLIAAVGTQLVQSEKLRQALNPAFCAGAVLVVLAVLTFHQGTIYLSNERLWSETISDNSQSLLAMEEYADALLDQAHFDAAKAWFGQAQSIAPNDPRAAVGLGTVAAARAYEDKAAGHPELMTTQQTSARQYFNDAIRVDPDYKPAYVALAELLELEKDHNGAMDALRQAVRIEPDSLRARLELGSALLRVGTPASLDEAQNLLMGVVDDAPNISAGHSELGSVYIQQHNLDSALSEWQKALQLDPTNSSVLLNFGALLDSSNQTDLAAKQFLAATLVDPTSVQARMDLAHVYSKLGHRHDAVGQLTQAVQLDPSNTDAQAALAKALADENRLGPGSPASSQPSGVSAAAPASGMMSLPPNPATTAN